MARIAGVNLPGHKRIDIALSYIYGIGRSLAKKILQDTNIDGSIRTKDLTESQIAVLNKYIEENLKVEGDLRREVQQNIKRYVDIGCYRGLRHRRNLPVHGQRTRTNARTRRGPRKTVGAVTAKTKKAMAKQQTKQ
ncbi:MAG: 30S ribosomal protein S13 [Endomicrobia bacterium]|nr:30S ribosomal protein S13 [Endomicrobiia bacterium]MCX7941414.1 30S ribosomal protein S13 [Endomicrobiia bacterium]MDW8055482.1 30S ribosomal protein S13 [Elusimicrobiota bacterium]